MTIHGVTDSAHAALNPYIEEVRQLVDWATGSVVGAAVLLVVLLAKMKALPWQRRH